MVIVFQFLEKSIEDYKPDLSSPLKSTTRSSDSSWLPTTIDDYTTAYKSGKFSPIDVAEQLLKGSWAPKPRFSTNFSDLEVLNAKLNMICEYFPDQIRAQARASAASYAEVKPLGPLDGVPIAMKDQLDIEGHRRRNGLEFCESGEAIEDCTVTARRAERKVTKFSLLAN
jgi:Asp-tRNA(Asn)/Glu-tRNA(Gln) amidotransferase A subunit family amidase